MLEQLVERTPETGYRSPSAVEPVRAAAEASRGSQDSIRKAVTCIDSARQQMAVSDCDRADEVLNLLRAATGHLHQALRPSEPAALSAE